MPYDFTADSFKEFSEKVLAANGDQAILTSELADLQMAWVSGIATAESSKKIAEDKTAENERLLKANMDLYRRNVGQFVDDKRSEKEEKEAEKAKEITTRDYMNDYFKSLDGGK